jgi:hypothetical protein
MKHKKPFLFFIVFSILGIVHGGNIVLCKSTKYGIPKESIQVWNLEYNKKICVFYQHDYIYNSNTQYRISISKQTNGVYIRTENKYFPVQKGQKTSIVYLDIKEAGNYIISIIDEKGFITSEQNYTVI